MDGDGLRQTLEEWMAAWNERDIDRVVALLDEAVVYEHWSGLRVEGRERLRAMWRDWFAADETIRFDLEDLFVGDGGARAVLRWTLHGRSLEEEAAGAAETRRGVDVLRLEGGLIVEKITYSKTTIGIDGRRRTLRPRS